MNRATRIAHLAAVWVMAGAVVIATADGFAQSWAGLYQWALAHGLTGWKAMSFPAMVDVFIAVGELGLFALALEGHKVTRRAMSWLDLAIPATIATAGWCVSLAFNVGHVDHELSDQLTAAVPPIASMLGLLVLLRTLPFSDVPDGRKVYPHLAKRRDLGLHPLLAIFDEVHTLFEHPEYGDLAAEIATRLVKKARAYGIILVLTTQRPDANSIPRGVSDNAITRILLAVTGHIPNDLIAGTGAYKRGVRGTMFDPERDAGTGWLVRSALNAQIARAAFIKQAEAQQIGKRALALRIAAGTLSGQAAGEDIEAVDESTIVDHLREVWPDGEQAMHSHVLVEALGALRPDLYGGWCEGDQAARSTMLATSLKPYGIHTTQVHKRGAGGGGKGLRWEDVRVPVQALDED